MKLTKMHRSLSLWLMLGCVFLATGCIIPVRTKTVIQNPTGQKASLPRLEIVPGQTAREEVEGHYKEFAVDSGASNLFWGRFRKSKWAVFYGVGGYGGAAVGGGRTWGTYNLLVSFDANSTVKTSELIRDKELVDRFVTMCQEQDFPVLGLSQPVKTGGMLMHALKTSVDLQLSASDVVVTISKARFVHKQWQPQPPEIITVPLTQIAGIKVGFTEDAFEIPITLEFAEKTRFGRHIRFTAVPGAVLTLVRWQQQVKAKNNTAPGPVGAN